jgi:hypothetical protein
VPADCLSYVPRRHVPGLVWPLLDQAKRLGWPAVAGIHAGRGRWLLALCNFTEFAYDLPDLDQVARELQAIAAARTVGVRAAAIA